MSGPYTNLDFRLVLFPDLETFGDARYLTNDRGPTRSFEDANQQKFGHIRTELKSKSIKDQPTQVQDSLGVGTCISTRRTRKTLLAVGFS